MTMGLSEVPRGAGGVDVYPSPDAAWFQVRIDNQRARDLYDHLGFVGSHEYRYAERL